MLKKKGGGQAIPSLWTKMGGLPPILAQSQQGSRNHPQRALGSGLASP